MEDCRPHVALGAEDFCSHYVLVELEFLVKVVEELDKLVEELVELADALLLDSSSLEFPREALLLAS